MPQTAPPKPRLVYHPRYNISFFGLERMHPFDGRKYGRAYREIQRNSKRQLGRVPAWLTHWRVLRPMRWAAAGTILAAREAMQHGLAIKLGGGYHHASASRGEGFSIYNDIALAVIDLRARGLLQTDDKVAYIDLDAHQGNGVCHAFARDRAVFIFDMYNAAIYPVFDVQAKRRIDCNLPLRRNTSGAEYLGVLRAELPRFLDAVNRDGRVKLAIMNAGTDVHAQDELGGLALSTGDVLERDRFVLAQTAARGMPTLVLTKWGIQPD